MKVGKKNGKVESYREGNKERKIEEKECYGKWKEEKDSKIERKILKERKNV